MKKLLTAFAMALLMLGCAKEYDDTNLSNRVTTLETKVGNLEAQMKAISSVSGDNVFVQKVEQLEEDGKVVGVTVTYTNGTVVTFKISGAGAESSNLSVIRNADGELCWAIDGKIIQVDGKDLTIHAIPSFSVENGHLFVTVDGNKTDLGEFAGSSLGDAIFTDIVVTDDAVVLSLQDGSTIEIPFAKAFRLVIQKTQYAVTSTDPIEIPYTVDNRTENTVVDVFTDANFEASVSEDVITITPLAVTKGSALAYADSQVGLTSIVKLSFGEEGEEDIFELTDEPAESGIDYIAEAVGGAVEAHAVSNIAFDVKPQVDWIQYVETKAQNYTIYLTLSDNPTEEIRSGEVHIVRAGSDELLQTIVIAQKAGEAQPAEPDQEFYGKVFEITPELSENYLLENPVELTDATIEWRFYARSWHTPGMPNRLGAIEDRSEKGVMFRFSNGQNAGQGQLHLSAGKLIGYEPQVTKEGENTPYIFEAEKWHTLTVVMDGSNIAVYDNGEYINQYALSASNSFTFERIEFGMSWDENWNDTGYSLSQLFDGYIDYVRVWNVARSASEIKAGLCDVKSNAEGLFSYWRFADEPDNSFMIDRAGNNDIDWDNMQQMDGSSIRTARALGDSFKAARVNFDGNICAGTGGGSTTEPDDPTPDPDPDPDDPKDETMKAIYWGNPQAAAWYKEFNRAISLPDAYSVTIHFYYDNARGQRLANFGDKNEAPCNMLRFGQAGNNNQLEWMVDTGDGRKNILASKDAVAGQWNAVTLTAGADGYKIYINGEAAGEAAASYRSGTSFQAFEFANSWGDSYRSSFDGAMAYISVWSKQLSAEEVAANVFTTPSGSGLEAFWPMNEGEGATFYDATHKYDDIDLRYMTRCNDEVSYVDMDVTPYVEWREYPAI